MHVVRDWTPVPAEYGGNGCTEEMLMAALTQLIQIGELQVHQSEVLFHMLFHPGELALRGPGRVWCLNSSTVIIKIAECFGGTCNTDVFVPKVLEELTIAKTIPDVLAVVLAVHEMLLAHGRDVLPRRRLEAMLPLMLERFQEMVNFQHSARTILGGTGREAMFERAFLAIYRLAIEFLDASIFPWDRCAEALDIDGDWRCHVVPQVPSETLSQIDGACSLSAVASSDRSDGTTPRPPSIAQSQIGQGSSVETVVSNDQEIETTCEMEEALRQSEAEALQKEQEQVTAAILRSKVDGVPVSADDVIVFRLTGFSKFIQATLRTSPRLAACYQRVEEAGCEVHPSFSPATFLVPITAEQFFELGLSLQVHHVLALRADRVRIIEALKAETARNRPKLRAEDHAFLEPLNILLAPRGEPTSEEHFEVQELPQNTLEICAEMPTAGEVYISEEHVLHGFIHFPLPKEISEETSDRVCYSAPAGDASMNMRPQNPRRFKMEQDSV